MANLSAALLAALVAGSAAFAPQKSAVKSTSLKAATEYWDPMGLYTLGSGEAFDTFPNMFPNQQYLDAAEKKNGRMAMLGWTGVWATHQGGFGLGMHFDGFPDEPDWTKALGVFAKEEPVWFGAILALICIAEGEGVGHAGDNWRGKSLKKDQGNYNFDYLGLGKTLSAERQAHYNKVETTNGRAAMLAMLSLFCWKALPGSVPIMDILDP